MINLIPPHGQTALKHEYLLRVASVYGFMLAGVLIASTALMVPTYVLTSSQRETVKADTGELEETMAAFDLASSEISLANAVMAQLRMSEPEIIYSKIIEEIVKSAPSGITFATFQGEQKEGSPVQVIVQGSAKNRNTLASFKTALEESDMFETAEVPIADLVRDADLPFVVTITLSPPDASS